MRPTCIPAQRNTQTPENWLHPQSPVKFSRTVVSPPELRQTGSHRYLAEVESLAAIAHPNVVQGYEVCDHNGRP